MEVTRHTRGENAPLTNYTIVVTLMVMLYEGELMIWTWDDEKNRANKRVPERQQHRKGRHMKMETSNKLTPAQQADVDALVGLPDAEIDLGEMPEAHDWSDARRGLFYRPIKKQLTLRLDADVVAWFKGRSTDGEKYQTRINQVLRDYVEKHRRSA